MHHGDGYGNSDFSYRVRCVGRGSDLRIGGGMVGRRLNKKMNAATVEKLFAVLIAVIAASAAITPGDFFG